MLDELEKASLLDYVEGVFLDAGITSSDMREVYAFTNEWGDYEHLGELRRILSPYFDVVESGASKLVLASDDIEGYVYKIPFLGWKSVDKAGNAVEHVFRNVGYLSKALKPRNKWDYCGFESDMYDAISESFAGVVDVFCRTERLGNVLGYPVYVSKRCFESGYDGCMRLSSDSKTYASSWGTAKSYNSSDSLMDVDALAAIVDCYGDKKAAEVMDAVRALGIDDLTINNFMFDEFSRIHIIDYSGFGDFSY